MLFVKYKKIRETTGHINNFNPLEKTKDIKYLKKPFRFGLSPP